MQKISLNSEIDIVTSIRVDKILDIRFRWRTYRISSADESPTVRAAERWYLGHDFNEYGPLSGTAGV